MKTILEVVITKPGGGTATVQNAIDLPFAPYPGMQVECSAWKSSRRVEGVTLSLEQGSDKPCLHIHLGTDETEGAEEQRRLIESYKGHGWDLLC